VVYIHTVNHPEGDRFERFTSRCSTASAVPAAHPAHPDPSAYGTVHRGRRPLPAPARAGLDLQRHQPARRPAVPELRRVVQQEVAGLEARRPTPPVDRNDQQCGAVNRFMEKNSLRAVIFVGGIH